MNDNQKGTALTGAALTDEVLDSSDSILKAGSYGQGIKGLQQFYTPERVAQLVASLLGPDVSVLDPTAGDGSLLKFIEKPKSFGIEIDADQIKNSEGGYNALAGDFQNFYSLIKNAMSPWPAIVANPPFGLQWQHPAFRGGKSTNSTVMTFMAINRLLADDGQYVFICGAGRYDRQLANLPENEGVYAIIECDELFEGTREPCVILFGLNPANRSTGQTGPLERRKLPLDMIDMAGDWVRGHRTTALGRYNHVGARDHYSYRRIEEFKSVQEEYNRRVLAKIKTREYDAQLYNGDHIQWYPSPFAKLALNQAGKAYDFHGLNGQPIAYFAQNERLWFSLTDCEEAGHVTIDPRLRTEVGKILGDIEKYRIPLYGLKPQQRLGFLDDIDTLLCTKDDVERRFKAGERYRLDTSTKTLVIKEERMVESKKNPGEYEQKTFEKSRKVMSISISGTGTHHTIYDGGEQASQEIAWLINHFEIPDKGEVKTRHPEEITRLENMVRTILEQFQERSKVWEETHKTSKPFSVRDFQVNDIARLLFKGYGLLAWEQGLGKTVGGLAFYEAARQLKAKDKMLVCTVGDLIPQWIRECERFLGKTPEIISTHGQAHRIAHKLRLGGSGIYITKYESLSVAGTLSKTQNKALPEMTVKEWSKNELVKGTDRYSYWVWLKDGQEYAPVNSLYDDVLGPDWREGELYKQIPLDAMEAKGYEQKPQRSYRSRKGTSAAYDYIRARFEMRLYKLTSKHICPDCHADEKNGWNGLYCEAEKDDGTKCGYAHYAVKTKPIAAQLSTAFHDGVIVLDEITKIQGDTSKMSVALRGLQARYRLGMTGTPIKNFVDQIFWPLAWCLGYGKTWFPYEYTGGKTRFQGDFCVIQHVIDGSRKGNRKVLPEVTNLSRFWRMLASCTIRRRAEETGEEIVDIFYHDISVPFSVGQAEQTREWLKKMPHGFPALFTEKYPDSKVVRAGAQDMLAPLLGLNWKLDYACTMPLDDPDHEWTGVEVSNWTPANLRTLELTLALVKDGRKVLVGSHIVGAGKWLAERLTEKGVKAVHIVDESGKTASAKNRAKHVYNFQQNPDVQVFCAGVKAIRLGHNLDAANAVILNGLDFDYETLDQFIKRARRLTSTKPVDVYVILPTLEGQQTITTRKWQLLGMKGNAADLALDGRLIARAENEIGEAEMIRQLQDRGFTVTDEAVDEDEIERAWKLVSHVDDFEIVDGVIPVRPEKPMDLSEVTGEDVEDVVGDKLVLEQNAVELEQQAPEEDEDDSFLDEYMLDFAEAFEKEMGEEEPTEGFLSDLPDLQIDVLAHGDTPTPLYEGPSLLPPLEVLDAALNEAIQEHVADATNSDDLVPVAETPVVTADTGPAQLALDVKEGEPMPPAAPVLDPVATLKGAKDLLDIGVITEAEYSQIRAAQLAVMGVTV